MGTAASSATAVPFLVVDEDPEATAEFDPAGEVEEIHAPDGGEPDDSKDVVTDEADDLAASGGVPASEESSEQEALDREGESDSSEPADGTESADTPEPTDIEPIEIEPDGAVANDISPLDSDAAHPEEAVREPEAEPSAAPEETQTKVPDSDKQDQPVSTAPEEVTVTGRIVVFPTEVAPVVIEEGQEAPAELEVLHVESVQLVTDDGNTVTLIEGDTTGYSTGQEAVVTLAVPSAVQKEVNAELEVEEVSEAEISELVIDVAQEQNQSLEAIELKAQPAVPVAEAGGTHWVDVVYLEKPGRSLPKKAAIDNHIKRLSEYWKSETNGKIDRIRLNNHIIQAMPNGYCNSRSKQNDLWGASATAFGNDVEDYYFSVNRFHLLVLESEDACDDSAGSGLATLGNSLNSGGTVWATVERDKPREWNGVVFHEFGHNFSLDHSNELVCNSGHYDIGSFNSKGRSTSTRCTVEEYFDVVDVMGMGWTARSGTQVSSNSEHVATLNVTHKIALGVLPSSAIKRVSSASGKTQTVDLRPSTNSSGVRAIEVVAPNTGEKYYLEYRAGNGKDAKALYNTWQSVFPGDREYGPGVRVLRPATIKNNNGQTSKSSIVLNRPAKKGEGWDNEYSYLTRNAKFTSHNSRFTVTVTSVSSTRATVQIRFGASTPSYQLPRAESIAGKNRFSTAVAVSKKMHPKPKKDSVTVIVATGLDYPDSLSAASFGALRNAPLLLTSPTKLSAETKKEIQRLKPAKIIVVGGRGAVSSKVAGELKAAWSKASLVRVQGADRYSTSVAIARAGWKKSDRVFIATGTGFADALSAGAAAGANGWPVILVPGSASTLPSNVRKLISDLGATKAYIAGGTGAVSKNMERSVKGALKGKKEIVRYAGQDRYDTSARIGKAFNKVGGESYLANGSGFADALSGAVLAGKKKAPLMLASKNCVPAPVATLNTGTVKPSKVYLLGGSGVLNPATVGRGTVCR